MATNIPFNRDFRCDYGVIETVSPSIRRIVAHNTGPFTFTGTGTYIIGHGEVAVMDPGPDQAEHIQALLRGLGGERITHILVTHTHIDHSPASRALKQATGAPTFAFGPHGGNAEDMDAEEGADRDFVPDHLVNDGDIIEGGGWTIEAVHTPGHTSNHMCYGLAGEGALFTGDHVMGWSTSVISPPDGNMADYMQSLEKLVERDDAMYWPTHGAPIGNPRPFAKAFIAHRRERDEQILDCLAKGMMSIPDMVGAMYADVPQGLHVAAARSVLAHLIHMVDAGRVQCDGRPDTDRRFILV